MASDGCLASMPLGRRARRGNLMRLVEPSTVLPVYPLWRDADGLPLERRA